MPTIVKTRYLQNYQTLGSSMVGNPKFSNNNNRDGIPHLWTYKHTNSYLYINVFVFGSEIWNVHWVNLPVKHPIQRGAWKNGVPDATIPKPAFLPSGNRQRIVRQYSVVTERSLVVDNPSKVEGSATSEDQTLLCCTDIGCALGSMHLSAPMADSSVRPLAVTRSSAVQHWTSRPFKATFCMMTLVLQKDLSGGCWWNCERS